VPASATPDKAKFRLYTLSGLLCLWFLVICLRLIYLQVFCYGDFEHRAQHQQQRTFDLSPKRGVIYDRAGRELAMSIQVDSAFAVPTEIPDLPNSINLITRITKEDPRVVLADCRSRKTFCWVARKADAEAIERIRALNLQGIHFQKEPKRFYPKRELAAQVLGYVGTDDEGLSGLERQFNDDLKGKPGRLMISVDARKKWFASVEKQPEPGNNLVLTIDQNIQYIVERELEAAMEQTHAIGGTVIVENPHTGEILALANRPTFNPNLRKEITVESLKDRAVSDVFEPGSTFKIVTVSAALEEKLTRPDEIFDCQMGSIVINGMRIRDHKPFGLLPVSDIIAKSSDVGAIKIALRLGEDRFYKYIRGFGFGQQTGIELPGETRGLTKPTNRWSKVSIGAISMGQEIGISPLQLADLISTIANDGVWVAPRIVAGTLEPYGVPGKPGSGLLGSESAPQTIAFQPGASRRVISTITAAQMRQMLQGVVIRGTGRKAILEGYSSAGKTGTAQKVDPATGAYSKTKYVGSFAGFAPVNNPQIAVAVILDSAVGPHQGGQVAAPVFQRIVQQTLEYLHVPHDVELPPSRQVLFARRNSGDLDESSPDHFGATLDVADSSSETARASNSASSKPVTVAAQVMPATMTKTEPGAPTRPGAPSLSSSERQVGDVAAASSEDNSKPKPGANSTVVLDVEEGGIAVPSFLGKSVRAALEVAQDAGLDLDAIGSGVAQEQSPAPGAKVAAGARVIVRFGR
jgi:cell division protein FtsI (penicillin-binding protein 3)